MMKNLLLFASIVLCICHLSCKKNDTNEDATLSYRYQVKSTSTLSIGATTAGTGNFVNHGTKGSLTWGGLSFNLGKVTMTGTSSGKVLNIESGSIGTVFPFAADSLSGKVKLTAGHFQNCSFNFQLTPPPAFHLLHLLMFYYDMNNIPCETYLFIDQPTSFVINTDSFTIEKGESVANVDIDMRKLLTGLTRSDFESTIKETGSNVVILTTTKNKLLYDKIVSNIASAFSIRISKP
jgi:hypothetical protein